jgi:DNA-binding NarL/FixJ family response regulator
MEPEHPDNARPRVLLMDDLPLRRAGLARLLEGSAGAEGLDLEVVESAASAIGVAPPGEVHLVLLSIGGASADAPEIQATMRDLRRHHAAAPIAVLADRYDAPAVVAAARAGARAFFTARIDPPVMIRALRFVIAGGAYFPPDALLAGADLAGALIREGTEDAEGADRVARRAGALTARQVEVLKLLQEGLSNKRIARELSMCESTVKVHVRQIMVKLGASNRTQAALSAVRQSSSEPPPPAPPPFVIRPKPGPSALRAPAEGQTRPPGAV